MEKKLIVVALGGNALQVKGEAPTIENQIKNIKGTVKSIVELIGKGYKVVVTHGNGPQIGRLLIQSEKADSEETPAFPVDVCGAMSQALIGYHIEQAIQEELAKKAIDIPVATILTQVEVDPKDPAFSSLNKPIGPFYSQVEAEKLEIEKKLEFKKDGNRGYRRVIGSPEPQKILELKTIETLVEKNSVVICCGGGGIPVIKKGNGYSGIDGVIDKDKVTSLLAQKLHAEHLVILTEVKEVALNFETEQQELLFNVNCQELDKYIEENQFAPGSMLPKIQATKEFAQNTGNTALITTLDNLIQGLNEPQSGTKINK